MIKSSKIHSYDIKCVGSINTKVCDDRVINQDVLLDPTLIR